LGSGVPSAESPSNKIIPWKIILPAAAVLIVLNAGGIYWRSRQSGKLSEKDTIVLADFTNTTGDAVFDGTLRQGLAVQLEQSPYLSLISDERIQQTLKMMGQSPDARFSGHFPRSLPANRERCLAQRLDCADRLAVHPHPEGD
jgi:hypothetical protein